jgi:ferredoxin
MAIRHRITTLPDPGPINKSRRASLFGKGSPYLPYHRAPPRLLSVTESIVLPPRPKGGQYVKYQQIQYSRVARSSGIAADLSCAAGRRCDACSVVVDLGGPRHQLGQTAGLLRMKRAESSVADELNIRAVAALDEAREMPPGDGRAEVMNKAMILRNAVEVHEHFCGKGGAPAK